jgi:hypothetical protein
MEKISDTDRLELLMMTLGWLDEEHLTKDDESLSEVIAELEGDGFTFFHDFTLNRLIAANLIPASVRSDLQKLRESVLVLYESGMANEEDFRNNDGWKAARQLAKGIVNEITDHRS